MKQRPLTDAEFLEILTTFEHAARFDVGRFREQLEWVRGFYTEAKAEIDEATTAIKRQRHVEAIVRTSRRLLALLQEVDESTEILEAFRQADPSRPVYRELQALQAKLQVELRLLEERAHKAATALTSGIGKAGNRPDGPLHEMVRSVDDLYERWAEDPKPPTGWQADDESGELLMLLRAILRSVGVKKSLPAVYQLRRRAQEAARVDKVHNQAKKS